MAMIKCRECGASISSSAKACPTCGAPPPKRTSAFTWLVAIVLIPGCISAIWSSDRASQQREAQQAAKTPEQRDAERRQEEQFQREVLFVKSVKASLKNPASFELSDALRTSSGALCITYRGTNSFNAVVPGYGVYLAPSVATAGTASAVSSAWNKHCAGKSGTDMMKIRWAL